MSEYNHTGFFIGGDWRTTESDDALPVINPATEERIGSVPAASKADIDAAVAAARKAFDNGPWTHLSPVERGEHLARLAAAISDRADDLARLITSELGCTLFLSQVYEAVAPTMSFNYQAELAKDLIFEEVRISDLTPLAGDSEGGSIIPMAGKSLVRKEPVGVVASFPAFNFALPAVGQKAGPALLAGCTVIIKVPEPNPLAIFELGEMMKAIDFPAGVLNLVAARGPVSEYLVSHPGVDMVSFTGSTEVGKKIGAACGALVRPCVLELGGKSAAIVLPDADEQVALTTMVGCSAGTNSGQSCVALTRFLVPEDRYDHYAEALEAGFAGLEVGDPMEVTTTVGPLVTKQHRERVERHIARAVDQGASIRHGGKRPEHLDRGWFLEPTLLVDVDNGMEIAQEETFGPVATLISYSDEADAIRIANETPFGLSGSVFTADLSHGFEVAKQIRSGTFSVNTFAADLDSPFGGFKQSGVGREHGVTAVEEYLLAKTISVDPGGELPADQIAGVRLGTGPGTVSSATA